MRAVTRGLAVALATGSLGCETLTAAMVEPVYTVDTSGCYNIVGQIDGMTENSPPGEKVIFMEEARRHAEECVADGRERERRARQEPRGQNAYGPGVHMDATGRPYRWVPTLGHSGTVLGPVKPNAYGPGIGMDATGKPVRATPHQNGIPVYDASKCVGPVIMGRCHGSTIGPPRKTCHGTMLNGRCTGPMF